MKVEMVSIGQIKPYENNPRRNAKAVDLVAESIKEFGFRNPIVLDASGTIIAGHTRFMAAKKLGIETVPCIYAPDLTPEQVRAYRLADNKTGEVAKWNDELLGVELDSIQGIDMSLFGFDMSYTDVGGGDDFDPTPPKEPHTKTGDIYRMGRHLLICGDCTKDADVDTLMHGEQAALLLTDPPYNVAYTGGTADALKIQNDSMSVDEYRIFLKNSLMPAARILRPGGAFYIWHASMFGYLTQCAAQESGLMTKQVLVWVKSSPVLGRQDYQWQHEPCLAGETDADLDTFDGAEYGWKPGNAHTWRGGRKQRTVLYFDKPSRSAEHPTMKPLALWAYLIENSTDADEIVYDPFCGSGTTVIACERLGRQARAMEIDPAYCDVIVARWEAETGNTAELIERQKSETESGQSL